MSSDLFLFDEPMYNYQPHSNPNTLFHCNSLQEMLDEPITISPTKDQEQSLQEIAETLLSDSSPTHQMESLSLTHLQNYPVPGIKLEESGFAPGFGSLPSSNGFFGGSHSYGGESLMIKFMERSQSYGAISYDCDGEKQGTLFQPSFGALFQSPENGQSSGLMRRVASTGDLPKMKSEKQTRTTFMEEANYLKVARYSAEERKEKIDKYRAKRTQRNFNKTIKYACRKTLADCRIRVRGRFARSEEVAGEMAKSAARYDEEEEDDFSVNGLHEGVFHLEKMQGYCVDRGQRAECMDQFEGYFSHYDENNFGF